MSKIGKLIGLDRLSAYYRLVKEKGGFQKYIAYFDRIGVGKEGNLVGMDKSGNKYYENRTKAMSKDRWIVYAEKYELDFDGSQVSAEWYGWLHHTRDTIPTEETPLGYTWTSNPCQPTATNTHNAFMPYSTTKPKIHAWTPPKKNETTK